MKIIALLIIYIQDPCCEISITKFDSAEECTEAWDVLEKTPWWKNDKAKVIAQGCVAFSVKKLAIQ